MNTEMHSEVLVYWLTYLGWTKLRVALSGKARNYKIERAMLAQTGTVSDKPLKTLEQWVPAVKEKRGLPRKIRFE
jgi:hypothetical protein